MVGDWSSFSLQKLHRASPGQPQRAQHRVHDLHAGRGTPGAQADGPTETGRKMAVEHGFNHEKLRFGQENLMVQPAMICHPVLRKKHSGFLDQWK